MKSSGNRRPRGYGEGMHARICGKLGTGLALAKLNYIRIFRLVELYQPMLVPDAYGDYLIAKKSAARSDLSRYEYVADQISAAHSNGGHLDVGCQFGAILIMLARRNLSSIGVEYQYFSYLAAKELAYLNGAKLAQIVNADITEIIDRVPTVESVSMLSILHHIAQLFDDPSRYRAFLGEMLNKVTRLVILELASPDEGRFVWSEPNRRLFDGQSAIAWHSDFLRSHGFAVEGQPVYFPTHLGGTRPILIARRSSD
jgi:SAM-dependent methyltransferase